MENQDLIILAIVIYLFGIVVGISIQVATQLAEKHAMMNRIQEMSGELEEPEDDSEPSDTDSEEEEELAPPSPVTQESRDVYAVAEPVVELEQIQRLIST